MKTIAASLLFAAVYAQTACTATERLTANAGAVCPNTNGCLNDGAGNLSCDAAPKVCTTFADCANETNFCTGGACAACVDNASCTAASLTQCPTTGANIGICKADACTTPFATTTECGGTAYCRTNVCSAVCTATADCTAVLATDVCQTLSGMCGPACTTVADNCMTVYGAAAMPSGTLCGQTSTVAAGKPVGICYTAECQVAAPTGCSSLAQECTAGTLVCTTVACSGSVGAYVADTCPGYAAAQTNMFCTTAGLCTICDNATSATTCGINQTCEASTGNCTAIACDPTVAYATNLCQPTSTVCVVTDSAAPTVGTCKICDGSATLCGTGYTCNAGAAVTDPMVCMADACGTDVTTTCAGWQVCNASNQCEGKPCNASSICAETGICDTTGGAPGVCSACVIQSPTAQQTCPTNYYCKVTDYGVCTQDCTDDTGCQAYQACTVLTGQCEGDTCTDDAGCGNAASNPTTFAKCVVESPTLSRCMACSTGGATLTECPTGQFCSSGVAPQDAYTIGTCYNSECLAGNTDCAALTKTCSASNGLCVDIPCTTVNDAVCTKTGVCDTAASTPVCTTCSVTTGPPATSTCASGSWCTTTGTSTGACYAGVCTTANQDTTCTTITESCNATTLLCEQQTCATGADSECRTGLCTSSTAGANCKVCATTAECQAAGAGSQTTMYCNTGTGGCFTETCTGPVSTPVAVDSCTDYTQNCTNGACAASTCVAGTPSCRSGIDGSGTGGVCTSGACAACARTTVATVTTSDCPNATDYCALTTTAGTVNYCTPALCSATTATATTAAPVCDAWQSCDILGTGACVQIACDATTTCATQICGTDGYCAACDSTTGSGAECPATADDDTWYTCGSDGICVMTEDTGISGGGIAGIIIGSVVFLGAVVGLTLYCCKKDNKSHDAMQEALK